MMGLLDNMDDPKTQALLAMGFGLLNSRGNFGQGLGQAGAQAMGAYGDARKQQQQRTMQDQQLEMQRQTQQQAMQSHALKQQLMQQQVQDAQRVAAEREKLSQLAAGSVISPSQGAMAANGGPTMAAAGAVGNTPAGFDWQKYSAGLAGINPMQALQVQAAMKKDDSPLTVKEGETLVDRKTMAPVFKGAMKEDDFVKNMRASGIDPQSPPGQVLMRQWLQKQSTHAPGTSVNVNTDNLGLKPKDKFEMEQKLSADYGNATKMDRGIVSTAQDIGHILKQGGALKDQAAIYKFAKALDPDGAVREADYAAIVKTVGGLDYAKALVNKAMTGEQLMPKQRKEMQSLVNAMADVAKRRIGESQRKHGANAKLYNLNPDNVFSAADNEGWSIAPVGEK